MMKFGEPTGCRGKAAWPLRRRLAEKTVVDQASGCWVWIGAKQESGHGRVGYGGRQYGAHRISYELHIGPIQDGLVLDHLCKNPPCINPDHLEPVSQQENLLRGNTVPAAHAAKTCCPHGHQYSGENLIITTVGGRKCRQCNRDRDRARRQRRDNHVG